VITVINLVVKQKRGFHDPMNWLAAQRIPEYPTYQLLYKKKCDIQNSYATSGTGE
jgi:hypothetical protein